MKNFEGFILTGGKSSRMGEDKAFLKFGEKTFLENAFEILSQNCAQVKIVLNQTQKHFQHKIPFQIIFDIYENRGALGGIHAALNDCKTEFAVILAVDLPFVSKNAIEKLCKIAIDYEDFSAFVPLQNDGKLQPLCAVYRVKNCLPKLEEILAENKNSSVRDFLKLLKTKLINAEDLSSDKNLFANINTPSDFENI